MMWLQVECLVLGQFVVKQVLQASSLCFPLGFCSYTQLWFTCIATPEARCHACKLHAHSL